MYNKKYYKGDITMNKGKVRFNLELSQSANEILEGLQAETGKSKAEIIRMGVAFVKYAEDSKKQNRFIAVVDKSNGKIEKEIVLA
jgi:hypothetical protein